MDTVYAQSSVYGDRYLAPPADGKPRGRKIPERTPIECCNVLFINPSINPHTQNDILNAIIRTSFPMSLGYVAGYLEHATPYKCYVIDQLIDKLDDAGLESAIRAMPKPRIVGISVLTATCGPAYDLGRRIMEIDPDALIVMGGVHATVVPEEPLNERAAHIVVRGEGEATFVEIVNAFVEGRPFDGIQGITYRGPDGAIKNTPSCVLIKELDTFPPFPYHLFAHNKEKYGLGFYAVLTSRGCPYKCTFCSQRSMTALSYRYHSTDRALQDIETLVEDYGAPVIITYDDNFTVNKKRLFRLLDGIIEHGYHKRVRFEGSMRADNDDARVYDKLMEANYTTLYYGMETGSERIMAIMQKGETVEEVVDAIKESKRRGFNVGTTIIFGYPTETFKERWDTIKLIYSLPLDSVRFNILTPYPGTGIYHEIKESGKLHVREKWANFSVQYMWEGSDMPFVPEGTNPYGLMLTTMFANLYYYLRPSGIWKLVTKRVAGGNVVILPPRWYFSTYALRLARVGLYLIRRFLAVLAMFLLTKPLDWFHGGWFRKRSKATVQPEARAAGAD